MPKKIYKTDQQEWKQAHYGMTHKKWNEWNREYRKVRPLVLERDNNTCLICKGKSNKLRKKKFKIVVHHIKKVKGGGSNELNNLVTLCQFCNITIDQSIPSMERMFGHQTGKIPDSSGLYSYNPETKRSKCIITGKQMNLISKNYQAICDKFNKKNSSF